MTTTSAQPDAQNQAQQAQIDGLSNLLLLQQRARQCESIQALQFMLVNDSRYLASYQHAVLWLRQPGRGERSHTVVAISDTPSLDANSPFVQWSNSLCRQLASKEKRTPIAISKDDNPAETAQQWQQLAPAHALWVPLNDGHEQLLGGLLLLNNQPWQDAQSRIFGYWAEAAGHALSALQHRPRHWQPARQRLRRNGLWALTLAAISAAMFIPVRLSVLAPAEVVPQHPQIIRAGLDSTIASVHVQPGEAVQPGQVLISLDNSALNTQLEVARQALEIVQGEYRQASQSMLYDPAAKAALPLLTLKIDKQQSEVRYLQQRLSRSEISARQSGIAIFNGSTELQGRPVRTGGPLLTLADPASTELAIWLPVGDDIPLPNAAHIRLFPAVSPENYIPARLSRQGYQAIERPEAGLAYPLRAQFTDPATAPRIGQRGTARIEGEPVPLWFYLLRRPAAWLRQQLGL